MPGTYYCFSRINVVSNYEIGAIIPILPMRKLRFRDEVIKLPGFTQPVSARCWTSVSIHYLECPLLGNFTGSTHGEWKSLDRRDRSFVRCLNLK